MCNVEDWRVKMLKGGNFDSVLINQIAFIPQLEQNYFAEI